MELPVSFTNYIRNLLEDEDYMRLTAALEAEQPVSIRLNPLKPSAFQPGEDKVPQYASGFCLKERLTLTFDPLFYAGCYYVQEASSMFVEQILRRHWGEEPTVMLDLCATPGSKSTHIRNILPENSLLIASEVIRSHSQILARNLAKWGHTGAVVTNNDPSGFTSLKDLFGVILTDVPYSGERMFRKNPVAVSKWSLEDVEVCQCRQRRIISGIWPYPKPGGILVYSTCTYSTKGNEEDIRWVRDKLGAEMLPLDVAEDWNITGDLLPGEHFPVYRFLPYKIKGEGFFMAVLRKLGMSSRRAWDERLSVQGRVSVTPRVRGKNAKGKGRKPQEKGMKIPGLSKEQLSVLRGRIPVSDEYEFVRSNGSVSAFPKCYLPELSALQSSLYIVQAGVGIAEQKGRDWIPNHTLTMSRILRPDAFPREEISYGQAIAYLRKEAVTLSDAAPHGVILLTHKGIPLGSVKNIGSRANNFYPQGWRIRSGYLPEKVKGISD